MKKVEIKTKRMKLRPMTDGEIESLMEHIDNGTAAANGVCYDFDLDWVVMQ